ncbi:ribonuclease HII [Candidatus Saccharibacteria bacterium]|nr:ribonuclease HII [Candidatus Saccharibacteria bacterium]
MILGIDEVGRGPWAGPLVVGAVVLRDGVAIEGLTDSKKLSAKKRVLIAERIKTQAVDWSLGWVPAEEIDELGLSAALRLATVRAVEEITQPYDEIIIDGTMNLLDGTSKAGMVTTLKKADLLIPSVSAASIVAKVARDEYMASQDSVYQGYSFAAHVGYGTKAHATEIETYGLTPLHRRSFAPIAKYAGLSKPASISSLRTSGAKAEDRVQAYFESQGYEIVARNWRTKWCEIDIIAQKGGELFFVEVKYRKNNSAGGAASAIDARKLQQMHFAAELYISLSPKQTGGVRLVAALVDNGAVRLLSFE